MPGWLRVTIASVVTAAWVANFTASLVLVDYKPDPLIHAAFMTLLGYLFVKGDSGSKDGSR